MKSNAIRMRMRKMSRRSKLRGFPATENFGWLLRFGRHIEPRQRQIASRLRTRTACRGTVIVSRTGIRMRDANSFTDILISATATIRKSVRIQIRQRGKFGLTGTICLSASLFRTGVNSQFDNRTSQQDHRLYTSAAFRCI